MKRYNLYHKGGHLVLTIFQLLKNPLMEAREENALVVEIETLLSQVHDFFVTTEHIFIEMIVHVTFPRVHYDLCSHEEREGKRRGLYHFNYPPNRYPVQLSECNDRMSVCVQANSSHTTNAALLQRCESLM
jgi:hypothetical protein